VTPTWALALHYKGAEMRPSAIVLVAAATVFAQTAESRMPVTDAEKIADALRAGPSFVTKNATLLDWPVTADGEYRVLSI